MLVIGHTMLNMKAIDLLMRLECGVAVPVAAYASLPMVEEALLGPHLRPPDLNLCEEVLLFKA